MPVPIEQCQGDSLGVDLSQKFPACFWSCLALPERTAYALVASFTSASSPVTPLALVRYIFVAAAPGWADERLGAWLKNGGLTVESLDEDGTLVDYINNLNPSVFFLTAQLLAGNISVTDAPCLQRRGFGIP